MCLNLGVYSFMTQPNQNFAENNYAKPTPTNDGVVIELDEMWHFLRSKKTSLALESLLQDNKATYRLGMWN